MNRTAFGLSILAILGIAAWAYGVNYRTANALREVSRLRAEIATTREEVQVLRVEWAYLNAPDRLARLVAAHGRELGLEPLAPEQFKRASEVPFPPHEGADPLEAALMAAAASILGQHADAPAPPPELPAGLLPVLDEEAAAPRRSGAAFLFFDEAEQ
ncbi:MAG: cell division protein FtsL [Pseudomonadota bacterium]